jgi:polar amino acid transport system substrate-binding protein
MKKSCLLLTAFVWQSLVFAAALTSEAAQGATITAVTETSAYTFLKGDRVAGTATEVVEKTLQTAGLTDYQLKLYPWARAYDMALKEPGVLIYLIARTPVREQQFQWAGEVMKIQYNLYRLRARSDIHVKTLADAKNYTIGVVRDDVRQQYLQTKGFHRLTVSAQSVDNFNKLVKRQVDLIPLAEVDTSDLCTLVNFDCAGLERVMTLDETTVGLYMAYSTSTDASIVQKTRAAFDKLKADGTVRQIMEKKP